MSEDEDWGYSAGPGIAADYANAKETPGLDRKQARQGDPGPWKAPRVVTKAPCWLAVKGCKNQVDVTEEGMDAFVAFSKNLVSRGEKPLDLAKVFTCPDCSKGRALAAADQAARDRESTTAAIRMIKALDGRTLDEAKRLASNADPKGRFPERTDEKSTVAVAARHLMHLTAVMGSGYVVDLLRAIEEKRSAGKQRKPNREEF